MIEPAGEERSMLWSEGITSVRMMNGRVHAFGISPDGTGEAIAGKHGIRTAKGIAQYPVSLPLEDGASVTVKKFDPALTLLAVGLTVGVTTAILFATVDFDPMGGLSLARRPSWRSPDITDREITLDE
jgi:hypothetical protein